MFMTKLSYAGYIIHRSSSLKKSIKLRKVERREGEERTMWLGSIAVVIGALNG